MLLFFLISDAAAIKVAEIFAMVLIVCMCLWFVKKITDN